MNDITRQGADVSMMSTSFSPQMSPPTPGKRRRILAETPKEILCDKCSRKVSGDMSRNILCGKRSLSVNASKFIPHKQQRLSLEVFVADAAAASTSEQQRRPLPMQQRRSLPLQQQQRQNEEECELGCSSNWFSTWPHHFIIQRGDSSSSVYF